MKFQDSLLFAKQLDAADPLRDYRKLFHIPQIHGKKTIYLCGNSLGLQPKSVEQHLKIELNDWKKLGVEGHLQGQRPWLYYHHFFSKSISKLTGALPGEVVIMNQLTVNLNLMFISFYRPRGKRNKILIQANEFPSDYYAIEQQIKLHGLDPAECIVELQPRPGEITLRTGDIISGIEKHKDQLALIMLSAVNYYTGQFFEIREIAKLAQKHRIPIGLDLAHAIGNVELELHDWGIDFAVWCSYKYLNSGPGGTGGVFVHQKYADQASLPRLGGWWGNDEETRFQMPKHFVPQKGAAGWQLSNAPVLSMAAHQAALEIFDKAGIAALRKKSMLLTGFLEFLLTDSKSNPAGNRDNSLFKIITPSDYRQRGCQLSIQTRKGGKKLFKKLSEAGVIADWREPDVIRVAPVPLYNKFEEVYRFARLLKKLSE